MVMQTVVRSLVKARSCGRHVDNALHNPFVLTPPPLCEDCISLRWFWAWSADAGWQIARGDETD